MQWPAQSTDQWRLQHTVHQIHALWPQQPGKQHSAGRRRGQPAVGPLRWDGPATERHSGRRKNETPFQRKEESTPDGLDEEIWAFQKFLRHSRQGQPQSMKLRCFYHAELFFPQVNPFQQKRISSCNEMWPKDVNVQWIISHFRDSSTNNTICLPA